MLNDPRFDVIATQLEVLWILLSRPVVQRQIAAIALIVFVSWLLDRIVTAWFYPRFARRFRGSLDAMRASRFAPLFLVAKRLYFPLVGLILIPVTVLLFERRQYPAGLIENAAVIFWVVLLYEIILGLMDVWFSKRRIQMFRSRILLPLFIILPGVAFLNQFIDIRSILDIQILIALNTEITLGSLVLAALWFYGFTILSWVLVEALQKVVLPRTQAKSGVIHSITTLSRYSIKIIGVLVVFGTLGVDLTSLALIGTGLTVGIGFGLQQVVSNFISGLMLLFEQSLRPGDVIEINNQLGTVQELNMRSTTIRTVDADIVVPNETFLTTQLITYTKSNLLMRVLVPIGVSYKSDPKEVRRVLLATAVEHGLVLNDPEPYVFFDAFGDSSINFTLVAWIAEPTNRRRVQSDLNFMVWEAMAKHGIEIPFPQRDLNLGDGWQAFTQTMVSQSSTEDSVVAGALTPEEEEVQRDV
ncbi:MAG: mechanosensitive ion channel [Chloroflexota bacterium]